MKTLIKNFNNWFNTKFGWFFTNGMKSQNMFYKQIKDDKT
jgi:hypothetical protein